MGKRILLTIIIYTILTGSCGREGSFKITESDPTLDPWTYADLRLLDPDDAQNPEMDVLAVYERTRDSEIQIRLDFLKLSEIPDYDILLAFDTQPGGTNDLPIDEVTTFEWDMLVEITADRGIRISHTDPKSGLILTDDGSSVQVIRDPIYDTIVVNLKPQQTSEFVYTKKPSPPNRSFSKYRFMIMITPADETSPIDVVGPVTSNTTPPNQAPVLFAFWNTYPAYTPALALRRWDGAHTGPHGGRHGLYNLLRSARNANVPVVLLDLNNPASLAALDYAGQIDFLRELDLNRLIILPEAVPASNFLGLQPPVPTLEKFHNENQSANQNFNLSTSQFLFSPTGLSALTEWQQSGSIADKRIVFIPINPYKLEQEPFDTATTSIYRWGGYRLIPIVGYGPSIQMPEQATLAGPSMETRRAMIRSAVQVNNNPEDQSAILLLGGELPGSTWGIPQNARATFAYINSRPWIRPLNAYDLLTYQPEALPVELIDSGIFDSPVIRANEETCREWFNAFHQAPDNILTSTAWQYLMSLYAPVYPAPADLATLRCHYMDQVGVLLHSAAWAQEPYSMASCQIDPDEDGEMECLLTTANIYALFDLNSSSLSYAFYLDPDKEIHQLIGPSSQLITGLSDKSSWQYDNGLLADPSVISGAFAGDPPDDINLDSNEISFTWSSANLVRKTFRLLPRGLQIEYDTEYPETVTQAYLPLVLDPWNRFDHDWSDEYVHGISDDGIFWGLKAGTRLLIKSSAESEINTFLDSRESLVLPEDPNQDYPVGHYLPFPIALVELKANGDFQVQIEISP